MTVLNSDSVTGIIRSKIVLMIFTKRFFSVRLKGTSDSIQASGAVTQTTKSAGAPLLLDLMMISSLFLILIPIRIILLDVLDLMMIL